MTTVTHLQPADLPSNPAFAQGVGVEGPARTIYVGGQNGTRGAPPAITVDVVAGLANPEFLVEITAIAVAVA